MPTNGMTIDSLNTVSSLTAQDEVPVWDKEASGEPTRKITAQNLTNSVKTLGSLVNTTEMNAAIAQSTAYATRNIVDESLSFTTDYAYLNKTFAVTKTVIVMIITSYTNSKPTAIGCKLSTSAGGTSYILNTSPDDESYSAITAFGILPPGTYYLWGRAKAAGSNNVRVTVYEIGQ